MWLLFLVHHVILRGYFRCYELFYTSNHLDAYHFGASVGDDAVVVVVVAVVPVVVVVVAVAVVPTVLSPSLDDNPNAT